jgi:uncharacterized protein (TIRG00374 family)
VRRSWRRFAPFLVSAALLGLLYSKIDLAALVRTLAGADPVWIAVALAMVVPLSLLTSWRMQLLVHGKVRLGFGDANRLILAASVLNLLLPSKMGDILKGYFLADRAELGLALSLSLVVFEKAWDMLSLLVWCLLGLLILREGGYVPLLAVTIGTGFLLGALLVSSSACARRFFGGVRRFAPAGIRRTISALEESWRAVLEGFWRDAVGAAVVIGVSVLLWFLHLMQVWIFMRALEGDVPFLTNLALSPLAILAGLVPLTFAGVGTRDAALVFLYRDTLTAPTAAALGVLCTLR